MTTASRATDFPSYGGVERRSRNRYQVEIFCRVGRGEQKYPARIAELSHTGAFLECELGASRDTVVAIEIAPDLVLSASVKQTGWFLVDNRKGFYLGVQFSKDDANRKSLERLLKRYALETPAPVKFQFL